MSKYARIWLKCKICKNMAQVCSVKKQCAHSQPRAKMEAILIGGGAQSAAKE